MSNTRSRKSAGAVVANGGGAIAPSGGVSSLGASIEGNNSVGGSIGRIQLKGVLDGLVKRSVNEDKLADGILIDGDVEEGARDLLELNSSDVNGASLNLAGAATTGCAAQASGNGRKRPTSVRRRGRKRRRKDYICLSDSSDDESKEKHTPHIMTLFDRKVDLARFTTTTPLYTMCRDWMSNDPNNLHYYNNSTHGHAPSGGVTVPDASASLNHTDGATPTTHLPSPALPPPIPLPTDTSGQEVRLDIPKPLPPLQNDSANFERTIENAHQGDDGDMATYKAAHLQRWREIRSQWRKASALNQARYTDSFKVLKEMFQR